MGRRHIKIRKHDRTLRSGVVTSVKQHKRRIEDRMLNLHENDRNDKKRFETPWQKTIIGKNSGLVKNIDGAAQERKTVTAYWLTQHLSRSTYNQSPEFQKIMRSSLFVGLIAAPKQLSDPKDGLNMRTVIDAKNKDRGFDRKPASTLIGDEIHARETDGYNPLSYVATTDDVFLSPVIDHEDATSIGDEQQDLRRQLTQIVDVYKTKRPKTHSG